jgi:hypothetical protein
MKKFLVRLAIFSVCNLGLFLVFVFLSSWLARQQNDFSIKQDTKFIILGHSHSECAYNDTLIDNFENFSQSGESYFYSIPKLEEIIRSNPQVKTVFLECTNNQMTGNVEEWIYGKKYLGYYYANYFPYIGFRSDFFIIGNQPAEYSRNFSIVCKDMLKKCISKHKIPYEYGGYKGVQGTLHSYQKDSSKHTNEDFVQIKKGISEVQLNLLKEISNFLTDKKIELILIRTPQHSSYQGFANEDEYKKVIETEFSEVKFIDLVNFPLSDTDFRDPEHLNTKGAEKISGWMNKFLKEDFSMVFHNQKHVSYQYINESKITKK